MREAERVSETQRVNETHRPTETERRRQTRGLVWLALAALGFAVVRAVARGGWRGWRGWF
ncbi:MAG TPA: hypothetical protein VII58_06590 [Acidobacteriaceae bacterium]